MQLSPIIAAAATRSRTDDELLASWIASLNSPHSRRNFAATARVFLAGLPMGLREATVEDVRDALAGITGHQSAATARQYVLRIKSLLSYAHTLGYTRFNAGVTIKLKADPSALAQRIVSEVEIGLLIRAPRLHRDRVFLGTAYASGLRVSELVNLTWGDVIQREDRVQLSVTGKGGKVRQVLLPAQASASLMSLNGGAGAHDPVFRSRKGGHMTARGVHFMVRSAAARAKITPSISPHWLRHAHGSHAIDRGAPLSEVQTTLGHANVATTSGYLHSRPDKSSGLYLDEGIFRY